MKFLAGFGYVYRESWAFMLACPLLFFVPVAFELLQHVAEMHIGMYDSIESAQAADADSLRMAFGFVKTLALLLPGYWVVRFLAGGRDALAARTFAIRPVLLFGGFFAFSAILSAIQIFALPRTGTVLLITMAVTLVLNPLLARWAAAAPLGIAIGPLASAKVMLRQLPWAIAFGFLVVLPLMIPHYILGAAAIFAPAAVKWPILILDSLLVGYLAAVMVAATWVVATRKTPLESPTAA